MANYNSPALVTKAFEEQGSPQEQWTETGLNATVVLRTNWADRHLIMADILNSYKGYPNVLAANGNYISFAANGSIAPAPSRSDAAVVGQQSLGYEQALLTISYVPSGSLQPAGGGDPTEVYSESFEPSAEFITLNARNIYWKPDQTQRVEKGTVSKLVLSFDYVQTRFRLSSIPNATLTLPGKVNQAAVFSSLLNKNYPPETLLYNAPTLSRQINSLGEGLWTMNTRYSYRENTWNKYWRPDAGEWTSMYDANGAKYKNYELADFSSVHV